MPRPLPIDDLPGSEHASRFEGADHGATVSFFLSTHPPGRGARLHRHPYEETFIVEEGRASVRARWFRAHASMAKSYVKGSGVALAGPLRTAADGTREMVHPSNVTAALAGAPSGGLGLRPRYADVEGRVGEIGYDRLVLAVGSVNKLLPAMTLVEYPWLVRSSP